LTGAEGFAARSQLSVVRLSSPRRGPLSFPPHNRLVIVAFAARGVCNLLPVERSRRPNPSPSYYRHVLLRLAAARHPSTPRARPSRGCRALFSGIGRRASRDRSPRAALQVSPHSNRRSVRALPRVAPRPFRLSGPSRRERRPTIPTHRHSRSGELVESSSEASRGGGSYPPRPSIGRGALALSSHRRANSPSRLEVGSSLCRDEGY